jgi:hypothetical protein
MRCQGRQDAVFSHPRPMMKMIRGGILFLFSFIIIVGGVETDKNVGKMSIHKGLGPIFFGCKVVVDCGNLWMKWYQIETIHIPDQISVESLWKTD